jgi:hypothetical protein
LTTFYILLFYFSLRGLRFVVEATAISVSVAVAVAQAAFLVSSTSFPS